MRLPGEKLDYGRSARGSSISNRKRDAVNADSSAWDRLETWSAKQVSRSHCEDTDAVPEAANAEETSRAGENRAVSPPSASADGPEPSPAKSSAARGPLDDEVSARPSTKSDETVTGESSRWLYSARNISKVQRWAPHLIVDPELRSANEDPVPRTYPYLKTESFPYQFSRVVGDSMQNDKTLPETDEEPGMLSGNLAAPSNHEKRMKEQEEEARMLWDT